MAKFRQVLFHRLADDGVAVIAPKLHLARGVDKAKLDLLRRFGAAFDQPPPQFLQIGRHDEDIGQRLPDERIFVIANGRGALRIDIDQNVHAVFQILQNGFAQRAVKIAVHFRVFEKFLRGDTRQEIRVRK